MGTICLVGVLRNVRADPVKRRHGWFWEVPWSRVAEAPPSAHLRSQNPVCCFMFDHFDSFPKVIVSAFSGFCFLD